LSFFRWNDGGRREARVIRKDVDRGQHRGDRSRTVAELVER
jgi:hypothetical protein